MQILAVPRHLRLSPLECQFPLSRLCVNAPAGNVEPPFLYLDSDEGPFLANASYASRAAAHHWINNGLSEVAAPMNKPVEMHQGARHRMVPVGFEAWLSQWTSARHHHAALRGLYRFAEPIGDFVAAKNAPKVTWHDVGQPHCAEKRTGGWG
jgi:hypothetical protein